MRGGWETKGRCSGGIIAVYQPYLLDVDRVAGRLARFQSTYQEKASLIDGQRWRFRRTGNSARPLVMLPGIQGGTGSFTCSSTAMSTLLRTRCLASRTSSSRRFLTDFHKAPHDSSIDIHS